MVAELKKELKTEGADSTAISRGLVVNALLALFGDEEVGQTAMQVSPNPYPPEPNPKPPNPNPPDPNPNPPDPNPNQAPPLPTRSTALCWCGPSTASTVSWPQ